ncbi:MAG TPA: MarR family transcriptional regulator [Thermoanaerobaculia bacterium]|nr:MarR family transcriptional regulator [Thermoanaerobaculia bacterium]
MAPKASPEVERLHRVADQLHSAAIALLRTVRRDDDRTGLSPARLSALSVVVFAGPISPGDLARAEQVTAPTMSHIVAALEREDLVARLPDAEDRRAQRLEATEKGRQVLEEGRQRRIRLLADRLAALTPEDQRLLAEAGELLLRVLRPRS